MHWPPTPTTCFSRAKLETKDFVDPMNLCFYRIECFSYYGEIPKIKKNLRSIEFWPPTTLFTYKIKIHAFCRCSWKLCWQKNSCPPNQPRSLTSQSLSCAKEYDLTSHVQQCPPDVLQSILGLSGYSVVNWNQLSHKMLAVD